MPRLRPRPLFLFIAVLVLAACDLVGPSPAQITPVPSPIPTPTPTPAQLSAQIGQATLGSQSFRFAVSLSGKPVAADPDNTFTLIGMEGDLKRPGGVAATVKVRATGAIIDLRLISLAGKHYITNPVTRDWTCAPAGSVFDPSVLFDPAGGVEHLLQTEFKDVALVGSEVVDGRPNLHLRGTIAGAPLMAISANSLGLGTVNGDLWADAETRRITRIELVDPATDPSSPTRWTIAFSDYDKNVDVRVPPGVSC
jgi:lipoprotein LprG